MSQEEREQQSAPIPVSRTVLIGLETVRESGFTNMLDVQRVAELCALLGHPEAAQWVLSNQGEYSRGVFRGFHVVEE